MTTYTYQTAPTQFAQANGIRFACRRFGNHRGAADASQALRNMAVAFVGHLPWLRAAVAKTLAELDAR
jgi:hypothetical protein